jgi:hypothetical protein
MSKYDQNESNGLKDCHRGAAQMLRAQVNPIGEFIMSQG